MQLRMGMCSDTWQPLDFLRLIACEEDLNVLSQISLPIRKLISLTFPGPLMWASPSSNA